MGTVITVMNMKGGVGKTTVTLNLAGILARAKFRDKKFRVLAIDYDPQFNLSQAFLQAKTYFDAEKARKTCLAVLLDSETDLDPYTLQVPGNNTPPKPSDLVISISQRLDLLPSTLDLMYVAVGHSEARLMPLEERFEKFVALCKEEYDLILIDCHPAGSILTKTSLSNSDHVLIPVIPQRYALRGIGLMMEFISAKKPRAAAPTPHILFNCVPRNGTTEAETQIRDNPRFKDKCVARTLKRFGAFAEPFEGAGFVWDSKKPYSTTAWRNLYWVANELLERIGLVK